MADVINKRIKLQSVQNRVASVASLIVAIFCWYQVIMGTSNDFFLILGILSTVAFAVPFVINRKSADLTLYPDEKMIKDYRGISWTGSTALSWSTAWTKNVAITDKRIALSSNFFGVETYKGALSVFYNEDEYAKHKGVTACILKDVYLKDDAVYVVGKPKLQPANFTWKIKEDKDFIYQTIKKYRKSASQG